MRAFPPFLFAAALVGFGAFGGCGGESASTFKSDTTTTTIASTGSGKAECRNGVADGTCDLAGPTPETCACTDCQGRAMCNEGCSDDGLCNYFEDGGSEDCSCVDCYYKVPACSPATNTDCNDDDEENNPACTIAEACTCSDCDGAPECNGCVDNGVCNPFNEGCGCGDCTGFCNGDPSTTSVTTTTTATTTTATTTTATTTTTTSTASGMGGGGGGGVGGNGGAGGN